MFADLNDEIRQLTETLAATRLVMKAAHQRIDALEAELAQARAEIQAQYEHKRAILDEQERHYQRWEAKAADARRAALESVITLAEIDAVEYDALARKAYTSEVSREREVRAETVRYVIDRIRTLLDDAGRGT